MKDKQLNEEEYEKKLRIKAFGIADKVLKKEEDEMDKAIDAIEQGDADKDYIDGTVYEITQKFDELRLYPLVKEIMYDLKNFGHSSYSKEEKEEEEEEKRLDEYRQRDKKLAKKQKHKKLVKV